MLKKFVLNINTLCFLLVYVFLNLTASSLKAQNFADWKPVQTNTTTPDTTKTDDHVSAEGNSTTQNGPGADLKNVSSIANKNLPAEPSTEQILKQADSVQESSRYTLGINDAISISVARHPEVSGDYYINSEGKIQYEFVGDLKVSGLTKDEAKDLVTTNLSKYIISPDVTVKIIGYNSKVVYVLGEVGAPGKIYMHGDTITVHEALLQAGLPLLSASMKKSRLITPAEDGKAERKYVNVEALLYEGDLRENLVMKPGDVLYIPATILAKAMRVINPVAQPIGTVVGTGRTVYPAF